MKTLITATALALTAFSASAMVDTSAIEQYAPNADISALTESSEERRVGIERSAERYTEQRAVNQALDQ